MTHYRRAPLQQEAERMGRLARVGLWFAVVVALLWSGLKSIWEET